ncbi:undecaprenyl-diphosphate phosphatase [Thiomicrorhabdus heinhorstiae]|uniref:Undecaprenyl-diphosphatase n=1 Tax=Thiomicrorhabdus heinhorstiae TaxID=2748010 RepID=A0ABS0C0R5_9GAMM|nr:undecaprenyl-diphosphate phosphatase [Thiomicrorhabdus heinhorstiae]MBF6057826.1 undecaprenyl-diphosphate phosphatase [Thiomicrorhabdus heinhorstiae]
MELYQAFILGIIEGITEFLPISSTGHLIVVSDWLGLEQTDQNSAFEVIIQLAAILAVVFNYQQYFRLSHWPLWVKVTIAFLPIGIIGFIFSDLIKELFSVQVVAWGFIIGGIIFLLLERFYREDEHKISDIEQMTYKQAMWVGVAQAFALVPGTSRAGASIVGAMLVGLNRKASAEFSFLLALPVLAAASGYDFLKHYQEFADTSFTPLLVGFVVSFVVAYATIKLFMAFLQRFTFNAFGIYRIAFGVVLLALFV